MSEKWAIEFPDIGQVLEPEYISMSFSVNTVSMAEIVYTEYLTWQTWKQLKELFKVGTRLNVKYGSKILFNGFVRQVQWHKKQKGYKLQVKVVDPLYKLTQLTFRGGYTGTLQRFLEDYICTPIDVTNQITSDTKISLRFTSEINRLQLLQEACKMARIIEFIESKASLAKYGFYYDHQENALCDIYDTFQKTELESFAQKNRLAINSFMDDSMIVKYIQITNF